MEMAASFFPVPTSKEFYFESGYVDMDRFLDHEFAFLEFLFIGSFDSCSTHLPFAKLPL